MSRMRDEAARLGGDGVVAVRLTVALPNRYGSGVRRPAL
jgi:uncharacterized protein YbjQ (UPF0145 family)